MFRANRVLIRVFCFLTLFILNVSFARAESVEAEAINLRSWAKPILLLLFVASFIIAFIKVFNAIRSEDHAEHQRNAIIGWFVATGFWLFAFALASYLNNTALFNITKNLPAKWKWTEPVLIVSFMLVFFVSIIVTYNKFDPDNPSAIFNGLKRLGLGIAMMLIMLTVVANMDSFINPGTTTPGEKSLTFSGINYSTILKVAIVKSNITQVFFKSVSVLAVILFLITILQQYNELVNQGKEFDWVEWAKPVFIILVISAWPRIYILLDTSLASLGTEMENGAVKFSGGSSLKDYYDKVLAGVVAKASGLKILWFSFTVLMLIVVGYTVVFINWLLDVVVSLYIGVNHMLLGIVAPLALILFFSRETSGALMAWFKLFVKFYLLDVLIIMINVIGIYFIQEFSLIKFDDPMNFGSVTVPVPSPGPSTNIANLSATGTLLGGAIFIVMKVIFLIAGNDLVTSLLEAKGTGVGGAVSGMVKGGFAMARKSSSVSNKNEVKSSSSGQNSGGNSKQ